MLNSYRDGAAANNARIECGKAQLSQAAMQNASAAPVSPATGQFYWATNMGTFRVWNGSEWVTFGIPSKYAWLGDGTDNPVDLESLDGIKFGEDTTSLFVAGRLWLPRCTATEVDDVWDYEETTNVGGDYTTITPRAGCVFDNGAPCFLWYLPMP